ncbi:MAG: MFS transporter, partial [Vicinamibacterales bacterium]
MATTTASSDRTPGFGAEVGRFRWVICGLLFFATTINYIDRQVLGILAPDLQKEIGWTELDYGRIVIAFQVSYAVMMLAWGKILDRIGTKLGLGIAVAWWSLAAMATGLSRSAMSFGFARFMLGVGEAANFPASIKTVAEWFPKSERALATGIFNSGTNIGAVVAPIAVPLIAAAWGWRPAFYLTGLLGFIWLVAWWALYQTAALHPKLGPAERKYILDGIEEPITARVRLGELLGYRQLWAFALGKLLSDPIWWFYLFWLPKFLASEHGIRGTALIPYLTTVYLIADAGSIFGGYL